MSILLSRLIHAFICHYALFFRIPLPQILNQVSRSYWFESNYFSAVISLLLTHICIFSSAELTQCQKEASGEVKSLLPSFRPRCDENGDYAAQQCWDKSDFCWCVDKNGVEMPDSLTNGTAKCQDFNSGMN